MGGGIGAYYRGGILIEIARPDWVQVNIIQIASYEEMNPIARKIT